MQRGRASTKALMQELLPENWVCLLVGDEPIETTRPQLRRRKDLLLLEASKENTGDLSQSSVTPPAQLGKFYLFNLFILVILGLHCCTRAFSSCSEWGLLFIMVSRLLIAMASLVAEHGLQVRGLQQLWHTSSGVVTHRLQSAGSVVVAHGLSCSSACGIFPDQGSNPCALHWQADS